MFWAQIAPELILRVFKFQKFSWGSVPPDPSRLGGFHSISLLALPPPPPPKTSFYATAVLRYSAREIKRVQHKDFVHDQVE